MVHLIVGLKAESKVYYESFFLCCKQIFQNNIAESTDCLILIEILIKHFALNFYANKDRQLTLK